MNNDTFSLSRTDSGASMKSSGGPRIAAVFVSDRYRDAGLDTGALSS
jgi:hypothetical protein